MEHIWGWFIQLSARRGGGFGPAPLSYQEVDAWARLMGLDPTPWEIQQIMTIDDIQLKVSYEQQKNETKS